MTSRAGVRDDADDVAMTSRAGVRDDADERVQEQLTDEGPDALGGVLGYGGGVGPVEVPPASATGPRPEELGRG